MLFGESKGHIYIEAGSGYRKQTYFYVLYMRK